MNTYEAKADAKSRLAGRHIPFAKITARTVSFEDLARANPIFVTIHGAHMQPSDFALLKEGIPKPSEGGYILEILNTTWLL